MMIKQLLVFLFPLPLLAQTFQPAEIEKWDAQAKRISIIRDNWGIPHVYGKTDADAVFGLLYAQCEDDFNRVEMNYVEKLGRKAELAGESQVYRDLYLRLVIDSTEAKNDFVIAPVWLKKLLEAYADGINYFLYKNPQIHPQLLHRFEPWFPLLWTDGSIGAIITGDVTADEVAQFYGKENGSLANAKYSYDTYSINNNVAINAPPAINSEPISTGSNGFAIAPSKTANGNAILYINPHTTFFFRPEVQMTSEEGLQAYGAVTWGQFFIYQGFNAHCGWMHTSNNVDVSDVYAEKIEIQNGVPVYYYDGKWLPLKSKSISINYKSQDGFKTKTVTAWFTHHGPIMAKRNGQLLAVQSKNRNMAGLIQSWLRTKATDFSSYKKTMDLCANASNNTVFADDKGNIAYWHGNYIPVRDAAINWSKVVDGTTTATDWKGLHKVDEMVHVYNPATGWIQNCNSTPFTVSGSSSPLKKNYPNYMAPDGENFRAINAENVLRNEQRFTLDKVIEAGYNRRLEAFAVLIPALVKGYNIATKTNEKTYDNLKGPMGILKQWDYNSSDTSVATALAIEWAEMLHPILRKLYVNSGEKDQVENIKNYADTASPTTLLMPLQSVVKKFEQRFGTWQVDWGKINRFQRISGAINQPFNDSVASIPVPFASATWGMLPSYNSSYFAGTAKRYGIHGNSFICVVEFGKTIKAKSLLTGGNSGNPLSKHFNDQQEMYTKGVFKNVLFYKADVLKHVERNYHPGE